MWPVGRESGGSAPDIEHLVLYPGTEPLPGGSLVGRLAQLRAQLTEGPLEVLLVTPQDSDRVLYTFGGSSETLAAVRNGLCDRLPASYGHEPSADPLAELSLTEPPFGAARLHGVGQRREDWQTRLRPPALTDSPVAHEEAVADPAPTLPLSALVATLRRTAGPACYQALVEPHQDWTPAAEARLARLDRGADTLGQRVLGLLTGWPSHESPRGPADPRLPATRRGETASRVPTRIDSVLASAPACSFRVTARLWAGGECPLTTLRALAGAFAAIDGPFYAVEAARYGPADRRSASTIAEAIARRQPAREGGLRARLARWWPPTAARAPSLVTDRATVAHFLLVGGSHCSGADRRALAAARTDRVGPAPPDVDTRARYDHGLVLGRPLRADGRAVEEPLALPPALQPQHVGIFGATGSGKSTTLCTALLANQAATSGADILVAPKGGSLPEAYCRAHFARHGDLEGVYRFDCSETLPGVGLFDIRAELAAGVPRATAVQDTVDHYIGLLRQLMGPDRFDEAVRSPAVIRYLVRALFDPEHGSDAFGHRALERAVEELRATRTPPAVSDPDLERLLAGLTDADDRLFGRVMQGVATRIEAVPLDARLARICNHVPERPEGPRADGGSGDRALDLRSLLDQDVLVILDTGELGDRSQRGLALVVLSALWSALRCRERTEGPAPLVNLYLEEAAELAVADLVGTLLGQAREFDLGVVLAMQLPTQLGPTPAVDDLLANLGTLLCGPLGAQSRLPGRLAGEHSSTDAVADRLAGLARGEWLARLPAAFETQPPGLCRLGSLAPPAGHPTGDRPLADGAEQGYERARQRCLERTRSEAGIALDGAKPGPGDAAPSAGPPTPAGREVPDSTLPYTSTFPRPISYDARAHAVCCGHCENRFPPTLAGLREAVCCHASLDRVDRERLPVCRLPLRLGPAARAATAYSHQQLLFVQAVAMAHRGRFDPEWGFDACRDSMTLLREYCGLARPAVQELLDDELLRHDTDYPHRLYTPTSAGRELLSIPHREGVSYGDRIGDLNESTHHRVMVAIGHQLVRERYVADESSPVTAAVGYYGLASGHRLDVAGLDSTGSVRVTLEAERGTNDLARAALCDFDAMAECAPRAAHWLVDTRATADRLLEVLADPITGPRRLDPEVTSGARSRCSGFDSDGLTALETLTRAVESVSGQPVIDPG